MPQSAMVQASPGLTSGLLCRTTFLIGSPAVEALQQVLWDLAHSTKAVYYGRLANVRLP